ncbi:MAG: TPM domain-containing protein [Bacteroidales bacterium]|nr:TPM domain-containing protein [Bacteroidales bacterium]
MICCLVFALAQAQTIPDPMSPPRLVNDFAGLFSAQENALLEAKLRAYNDSTSTQIYVVVVESFNGYDKAQFAFDLGEKWGIGQKGKNNGAVMLIKPQNGIEKGEIFIATGYGLEGALPDAIINRIIDETIIPSFRQELYYKGVDAGINRMIGYLSGEYQAAPDEDGDIPVWLIIMIILIIIIVLSMGDNSGQNINRNGGSRTISRPMFFPTGGGGGFSSGGGGFRGGGGGSFGGGGAGGSW